MKNNVLEQWFPSIKAPIIMAPMFLVTNEKMMIAAGKSGILGCIPAHNFRSLDELSKALNLIKSAGYPFGVNLIVNSSNPYWKKQLDVCLETPVDFIITSLGSPQDVIEKCKTQNIKVLCDVTDIHYAKKVVDAGADGLVAVNSGAGGHLGKIPMSVLIPQLTQSFPKVPVISAGGVGCGKGILAAMVLGASGVSVGSPFIASEEAPVSQGYKHACVDYGAQDIVVSTKLSGTPCTVIATDYVKKIGTTQNWLEQFLSRNKRLKKYVKMLTFYRGMKLLEKAAFQASYQTVWCAGQSIEFTKNILPLADIAHNLLTDYNQAKKETRERL